MTHSTLGLRGLGYIGIGACDPMAWRDYGQQVCGLLPASGAPGAVADDGSAYLKLDDRQWRIAIHPVQSADEQGLHYLGLEVQDSDAFARALDHLGRNHCRIELATAAECEARCVASMAALHDPAGHRIELFHNPALDGEFRSPADISFLTGELGMGHVVLYVPDIEEALAFYRDTLGFIRTDYMHFGPKGMGIHFLRCTPRHHSIALLQIGPASGLQHLMLESTTLDGVGQTLDRAQAAGVPISSALGRHINDKTVSFYMKGPSGFDIEIGWDGLLIGEDWVEHEFSGDGDLWGHQGLDAESLQPDA